MCCTHACGEPELFLYLLKGVFFGTTEYVGLDAFAETQFIYLVVGWRRDFYGVEEGFSWGGGAFKVGGAFVLI